jgi:hypothetical protein
VLATIDEREACILTRKPFENVVGTAFRIRQRWVAGALCWRQRRGVSYLAGAVVAELADLLWTYGAVSVVGADTNTFFCSAVVPVLARITDTGTTRST